MRAVRFHGRRDLRVEQIEEPQCGQGQVKIAVAFSGICGTDLHEWLGGPTFTPPPESPHPLTKEHIPVTLGHEFSGTVTEVGIDVTDFTVGQHIAVQPNIFCTKCTACKSGYENVCYNGIGFLGLSGGGGGFSDYVVVPQHMCIALPSNVSLEHGALIEPLAVGAHAVIAADVKAGDNVLVIGGGPIGLAVLQALKPKNPRLIITAEVATARQRFAKDFGAHHVLDPTKENVVQRVRELCDGHFADSVFDCAGTAKTLETACKSVRAGGTVCNVAIWEKAVPFDPNWLVFKEAKYMATLCYHRSDFEYIVGALSTGAIEPGKMITSKIKLEDIVEKGFKALTEDKDNHVKILVDIKA